MDKVIYIPENVCSTMMELYIKDNKIMKMTIHKGCPGNTQGISRLSEGLNINYIENKLCGIKCPNSKNKQTSCPDQVSKALTYYKKIKKGEKLEGINIDIVQVPDNYFEQISNEKGKTKVK